MNTQSCGLTPLNSEILGKKGLKRGHEKGTKMPPRTTPLEKLAKNPTSRKLAIEAACYDCQGRDRDPKVPWRIGNCVCPGCPLYNVRPYQDMQEGE